MVGEVEGEVLEEEEGSYRGKEEVGSSYDCDRV